jgi:hypothetical protein
MRWKTKALASLQSAENPICILLHKCLYKDNATNLVPELISPGYVTNHAKVTAQMPTCKRKYFEIGLCGILVWCLGSNEAGDLFWRSRLDLAIFSENLLLLAPQRLPTLCSDW